MNASLHKPPAQRFAAAFTLVELLVVIGIIAVLISILLPALGKVRRQAYTLQCSSNMRQVSMAMLMYIQDAKGKFPAAMIPPGVVNVHGWWWPNELVRMNYIKTPGLSVYKKPNSTQKIFNRNNPFRCPEGVDEDQIGNPDGNGGEYPTDALNNAFALLWDSNPGAQGEGFGVPSWYQLATRTHSVNTNWVGAATGNRCAPFTSFLSGATLADVRFPMLSRHMGYVKKSSELLMMIEAANYNWYDQKPSTPYPAANLYMKRIAGRHGKKTADGLNAWSNFAFFDGHVALYPTLRWQHRADGTDNQADLQVTEVIFYINRQWKPN
jgi:prepilin-type N-terminal cleavage/methylation domain-containing protein/prepilin-type processing-associated H-X9-DG protein